MLCSVSLGANEPSTTSVTLLDRLRDPGDAEAWREFDRRYRELIVWFARRRGLQVADAEDAAQVVITKLVTGLRRFEYDTRKQGFRAYLYRCARSALADHFSRQGGTAAAVSLCDGHAEALPHDESENELFEAFEREWVDHHYRFAVRRYRETADERAIGLLEGTIAGRPAREIAEALAMTDVAVHKAQQRLRDRLKELIAEQLRDEDLTHDERRG